MIFWQKKKDENKNHKTRKYSDNIRNQVRTLFRSTDEIQKSVPNMQTDDEDIDN